MNSFSDSYHVVSPRSRSSVVRIVETVHKGPSSVAVGIYEPQIINSCHPVFPCWRHLNELYVCTYRVCTLLNQTIIIAVVVYKSEVL